MANPIAQNPTHRNVYLLSWVAVAALHTLSVRWTMELAWTDAILEGIVYSALFGLVGLVVWYIVRFSGIGVNNVWYMILTHGVAATLLVGAWLSVGQFILDLIEQKGLSLDGIIDENTGWRGVQGAIYYVMVTLNYYLLLYSESYREKQLAEVEMRTLLKESELSMLKAQLNPHFIFNSLNSISMLTLTRPEDAHEMVVKLSTFLRHTIGNAETDLVTLQKEIDTVRLYLDIEKSRFGDKLVVEILGMEDMPEKVMVPNMILQPLVENAIKYGVYEALEQSTITISTELIERMLTVTITNGCEEKPNRPPGKGIGLQNVRRRLQYLYERPDLLETQQEGSQFTVTLHIPQFA
ncbi:MAG: histidine kinase [Bacteroidota bacterium]